MYPPPPSHPYAPPPPPPPLPRRRWWQHPALIIVLLVIFPPAGIALAWTSLWKQQQKILATVLSGLWFLLPFLIPAPDKPEDDAKAKQPVVATTASPTPTPTPTPTPSPEKTEDAPVMPSLVGGAYTAAKQLLTDNLGRSYAVYKDVELPAEYDDWLVCFQRPEAGEPVAAAVPVVYLTEPGIPCPKSPDTVLHKPTPKPTTVPPAPKPTTEPPAPRPRPTTQPPTVAPEPEPTQEAAGSSVYYRNCTAARAAGAAPIHRGEPGYDSHLDRDGDGVACEG
ncbi:excalibur calcium-binding domain-containing protein [Streptomyces sp. CBMA291]|uniref:excalibur calcium-binding domain-containing protein n=1 Tax=unclassified Streptomyces TaxID=2593676 RepID=UPI00397F6CC7